MTPVQVITASALDPARQKRVCAPPGTTLAEMVSRQCPVLVRHQVRVSIGEHVIDPALWHRIKPKAGTTVVIRIVPQGNNLLRTVLQIAVVVAAIAVTAGALGPLGTGFGGLFGQGTFSAGLASASVLVAGNLLINALVPVQNDTGSKQSPTYSIQGLRNVANPDGAFPVVYGRHRFAPPYVALPYTETVGDDRYAVAMVVWGYGPLDIQDMRIGETPISNFSNVTYETRYGYADDAPVTIYPKQVIEEGLSVTATKATGQIRRYSARDCTEVEVEFFFAAGLFSVNQHGAKFTTTVNIELRYRYVDTATWITLPTQKIEGLIEKPFWRAYRWAISRGQVEIEIKRTTDDHTSSDGTQDASNWSAIRSFRPEYPLDFGTPLAITAIRMKASEQLQGAIDQLNAIVTSILPDFNGSTWPTGTTQNPASHYVSALRGPANAFPIGDDEIDWASIQDWHTYCRLGGLKYNYVHDADASHGDVLRQICAAGRATPHDVSGKWGVIVDRAQTIVSGHITARNSWGFSGERSYLTQPDAFRVAFKDESKGWENAERVVPSPGLSEDDVEIAEALSFPGVTNPDQIWSEARRRFRELTYRPDTYTVSMDMEHLANTRGDLVLVSHDILKRTQVSARVAYVSGRIVRLDTPVNIAAGTSYVCRFRGPTGSSVLFGVTAEVGEQDAFVVNSNGSLPSIGDLAMFGEAGTETLECIIKDIEVSDDLTARLTLIDHAPQIESETAVDTPPFWGPQGASPIALDDKPGAPTVSGIGSGQQVTQDTYTSTDVPVVIAVAAATSGQPTKSFEVDHRIVGAGSWTTATVTAAEAQARISGYDNGDQIEARARAIGFLGSASAYSATVTHTVGGSDLVIQPVSSLAVVRQGAGTYEYTWALGTPTLIGSQTISPAAGVHIRYRRGIYTLVSDLTGEILPAIITSPTIVGKPTFDESYTFAACVVDTVGNEGDSLVVTPSTVNLLLHSDDPSLWTYHNQLGTVTFGANVADPGAGSGLGREITFSATNSAYYAKYTLPSGSTAGRTFNASFWAKSTTGKAEIGIRIFNGAGEATVAICALTTAWQRFNVTKAFAAAGTIVTVAFENRSAAVPGLNDAAGKIEAWGGQISENSSVQTYQVRA